ncbi:MAG: hypothetical protein ACOZF0_21065 [Thermodesulfobacteriota bacterium]
MGKNISIYLNDDLLQMVEASGQPVSQVVQTALKKYFFPENRSAAFAKVFENAQSLGKTAKFAEAIAEWKRDREVDRW